MMDLKQWQKDNRWSNKAMAKEIGVAHGTISNIRLKKFAPSLLLAKAIVRFTNNEVTLADLGIEKE